MTSYTFSENSRITAFIIVIITTFADDGHYKFNHNFSSLLKVVMVTVITVNITNFNNHYHVVILKIVSITMFCSDIHYTVFTVKMAFSNDRLLNKFSPCNHALTG